MALLGLLISVLFVRDTTAHARVDAEASRQTTELTFRTVFATVSWRDRRLFNVSQAGMINNLNDGVAWALFPVFFAAAGLSVREIGVLAFVYPATWGTTQLVTGALSDRWGRKGLVAGGMLLQGVALAAMLVVSGFGPWLATGIMLGVGTAMVYPTLLAAIGDVAHPSWRGFAIGVYRLWRDLGYAAGAIIAGALADAFGLSVAILAVALVTATSGALVLFRMPETHPRAARTRSGTSA